MAKKGFFQIQYEPTLKIPYEKIDSIQTVARFAFELESDGARYLLVSLGPIIADIIIDEVKPLMVPLDYPQFG